MASSDSYPDRLKAVLVMLWLWTHAEKTGLGCSFFLNIFSWLFSCGFYFWWKGWGYYLRQNQTVIHQTSQCVGQEARCVAWLFGQHLFLAPFNVRSFCACSKVCWGIKIPGEKGYFLLEYSQLRCADCWNNSNICTRTRKHTQERIGHIWPLCSSDKKLFTDLWRLSKASV